MEITLLEKLQIIAQRKGLTITKIADTMHVSKQGLSAKLKRGSFTYEETLRLAEAIGVTLTVSIKDINTGEDY